MRTDTPDLLSAKPPALSFVATMSNPTQNLERTELISDWPDIAFQYYVLARAAKQRYFWYAAGGCAHFAVELILKYLLVVPRLFNGKTWPNRGRIFKPNEVRGHSLPKLWHEFGIAYPDHPLGAFNQFVNELDRWGGIRYAQLAHTGAVFTPTVASAIVSRDANAGRPTEVFAFDLSQLDQFFREVLEFIGADRYLIGSQYLVLGGRDLYEKENPFAIK
jgi:hypothetical protein